MVEEKPLTKSDLVAALKEIGIATQGDLKRFATKDDIREIVQTQIVDLVATEFERVNDRLENMDKRFDRVEQRIDQLDQKVDLLSADLHQVKTDVRDLHVELSATPSRTEVDRLASRLRKLEIAKGSL